MHLDWTSMCLKIKNSIQNRPQNEQSIIVICFGKERVEIGSQTHQRIVLGSPTWFQTFGKRPQEDESSHSEWIKQESAITHCIKSSGKRCLHSCWLVCLWSQIGELTVNDGWDSSSFTVEIFKNDSMSHHNSKPLQRCLMSFVITKLSLMSFAILGQFTTNFLKWSPLKMENSLLVFQTNNWNSSQNDAKTL